MDEILKLRIGNLRDLLAKTNWGDWQALPVYNSKDTRLYRGSDLIATFQANDPYHVCAGNTDNNATCVAETINALPYLLDELERLQGLVATQQANQEKEQA